MPFAKAPMGIGSNGSGSIAVCADGTRFLWAPAQGTPSYSDDRGLNWTQSVGITAGAKIASDRVNGAKFYASRGGTLFFSTNAGASFTQVSTPAGGTVSGRPHPVFGVEGDVWVATSAGLVRSQDSGVSYAPVAGVNSATAVGFGKPLDGNTYPAVYVAGSVANASGTFTWGIYRSDDAGQTWNRVDDPNHQFGFINVLTGDPRQYGRVYLGTGGRGIVYGDPQLQ